MALARLAGAPVLELTDDFSSGGEQGLLGLAFHPSQPLAYVNYTDGDGDTTVSSPFSLTIEAPAGPPVSVLGLGISLAEANLANGDVVTATQSAVVLENLISQFLFSKAAEAEPAATGKPK